MEIKTSKNVPDSTYFRTGDAEPVVTDDGAIEILNGTGSRRSSWGQPGVTSTVVVNEQDFVAIHIGFFHKHGGSQFWRYFVRQSGQIKQVSWRGLTSEQQTKVLAAPRPSWAKAPGKVHEAKAQRQAA